MGSSSRSDHVVGDANAAIKTAAPRDIPVLLSAAISFYREDGFDTSEQQLAENLKVLIESSEAHVALAAGSSPLLGFAITTTSFGLESGLIAELEDLFVYPPYRGLGIGDLLIGDAVLWARSVGASQLEVVTAPNGADISRLNAYYELRGFINEHRSIRSMPL